MIGAVIDKRLTILLQSDRIKISFDRETFNDMAIEWLMEIGIGKHSVYLLWCAFVVSFVISFIGVSVRNLLQIYRSRCIKGFWYEESDNSKFLIDYHIFLCHQVVANGTGVINIVPKPFTVRFERLNVQVDRFNSPLRFFHAHDNRSTLCIGESGISRPKRVGKSAGAFFEFQLVVFGMLV